MNRLWWVDPFKLLILLIAPIFLLSAVYGGDMMPQFKTFNFLTLPMIALGGLCIAVLALGTKVGTLATSNLDFRGFDFDPQRFDQVFVGLLAVTLIAHLLLVGSLIADPALMHAVLSGERGATFDAKNAMIRIVGVTSLTNVSPLVFCLCSVRYITRGRFAPSPRVGLAMGVLLLLVVAHALLGSERLALIENAVAAVLPLLCFIRRWKSIAIAAPFVGTIAVTLIFSFGEYTRSWPYYHQQYDSFTEFVSLRLLAYVAVASNSGAGMILTMPPVGYPYVTGRWLAQIPLIGVKSSYGEDYLRDFGNEEFNNPSGVFAAVVDFGSAFGLLYLFLFGLLIGTVYGFFRRGHPAGLLAYPLFFTGLIDLTQVWYWGDPRFVPMSIALVFAITYAVRRRRVHRVMGQAD